MHLVSLDCGDITRSLPSKSRMIGSRKRRQRELQVSDTVVKRLIRERVLPAKQVVKFAPWIIEKNNLLSPAVQQQVKAARRGGHRLPQIVLGQGQLSLE